MLNTAAPSRADGLRGPNPAGSFPRIADRHRPLRGELDIEAEAERLQALAALEVLDALEEPSFRRITAIAQRLLETDGALIDFVGPDKVYTFASAMGGTSSTPRNGAYCNLAIQSFDVFHIEDAPNDPRPEVREAFKSMGMRFYAAAPLILLDGAAVGTLCVFGREPRGLAPHEAQTLSDLSLTILDMLCLRLQALREKAAQAALEQRNRLLVTQRSLSPDGIVITDPSGRYVTWNSRFQSIWGIPTEAMVHASGHYAMDIKLKTVAEPDAFAALLAKLNADPSLTLDGHILALADGRSLVLYSKGLIDPEGGNEGRVWYVRDVTRLRESQLRLASAERQAALGRLVVGIAHEMNTPLGIATSAISLLGDELSGLNDSLRRQELSLEDLEGFITTARRACDLITHNVFRASELVASFKRIGADRADQQPELFELRQLLSTLLATGRFQRNGISVSIEGNAIEVEGFSRSVIEIVEMALENCMVHAFADRAEGRIVIRTQPVAGDMVEVAVIDDGIGIPAADRSRVLDPFFTSRRGEGRAGLGLHVGFALARNVLGGSLAVDETPGGGTTVFVRFPRLASAVGAGVEV